MVVCAYGCAVVPIGFVCGQGKRQTENHWHDIPVLIVGARGATDDGGVAALSVHRRWVSSPA